MKYITKAKKLTKFFNMYGYGHFDLTVDEIAEVLEILDSDMVENRLLKHYEKLDKIRMG